MEIQPDQTQALSIDTAFDAVFADRLARLETFNKHHYRPNTYLHKWWGRRCGTTFRMILKGLVENPENRDYYQPGGLEGKVILDPMMGGGTTMHEAIRLGANTIGVDIDPIPVVQARATLSDVSLESLELAFRRLHSNLVDSMATHFFTHCPACDNEVPFWYSLYGLRKECKCGEVVIVDSLVIRHQPDGSTLRLCSDCHKLFGTPLHDCPGRSTVRLIEKHQQDCPTCGAAYRDLNERPYYDRYQLLAITGHCRSHGLFYRTPDSRDRSALKIANDMRSSAGLNPDDFKVVEGDKSVQLLRRGIENYLDLFSSRQLLFMSSAMGHLCEDDPVLKLNLALLLSTSLEFNSMLCGYKGVNQRRAGAVRHTFSHHGYVFPYTALETNPIYPRRASGTLEKLFYSRIWRGRRWARRPVERVVSTENTDLKEIVGECDCGVEVKTAEEILTGSHRFLLLQRSGSALPLPDACVDAVVTDPPYYDSIQYGDLSAFFRVWLRQIIPESATWGYDMRSSAVSPERDQVSQQYVDLMTDIFSECNRILKPNMGRLIFTFHHWEARAWAALSMALHISGFNLVNRYVVHAEHPMSVHINKMKALTHDAILVLAPSKTATHQPWPQPQAYEGDDLRARDSFQLTEACASYLGWILDQPIGSLAQCESLWRKFLNDGRNGHKK